MGPLEDRALNLLKFLGAERAPIGSKYVLVMGTTGSGKSRFISRCTGADVGIGHELKSCTDDVGVFHYVDNNQDIYLIDTPGFDDTSRSDIDTLRIIAYYLSLSFANGNRIDGIIYLHRISNVRFTGSDRRTIDMLKALSGSKAFQNIIVATTMWQSEQRSQLLSNENELMREGTFFGELLAGGSRMKRHAEKAKDEVEEAVSAKNIVASLLKSSRQAIRGLQIQREMIEMKLSLSDTTAGKALLEARTQKSNQLQQQQNLFQQQEQSAARAKDTDAAAEFKKQQEEIRAALKKIRTENAQLEKSMQELHAQETKKLLKRLDDMEKNRQKSTEQREKEVVELQNQILRMKQEVTRHKELSNARSPKKNESEAARKAAKPKPPVVNSGKTSTPALSTNKQQETQLKLLEDKIKQLEKLTQQKKTDAAHSKAKEQDAQAAGTRMRDKILPAIAQAAAGAAVTAGVGALAAVMCSVM